ncbi:MAG: hypothetical protein AAB267_01750, partial [Candidatus Desantisbacteria bacterium]
TLLITDTNNYSVIEVDPITHNVIWQYGGVPGTGTNQLNSPVEAAKLKNGNVLTADTSNCRVIEVQPTGTSGGTIVWQYGQTGVIGSGPNQLNTPLDVKKLDNGNVLIADDQNSRVIEVQPTGTSGGTIVWQYSPIGNPIEAERLPDGSTLIARYGARQIIRVAGDPSVIVWSYTPEDSWGPYNMESYGHADVAPLTNGNILITGQYASHVIELQPTGTNGGTVVWKYGQTGVSGSGTSQLNFPYEAIRLVNGNTMIVDSGNQRVIEVKTSDYPGWTAASIVWQQGQTGVSGSGWNQLNFPRDIEEISRGIFNQVVVEYKDMANMPQPIVTAWVFTPVILPVVSPPVLEVTKTVSPSGTQTPGTELTYTIAYHNTGQGTATQVIFTDMVPPGTIYGTGTAVIATGPTGAITYSHNGSTYDSSDSAPVTHIRWSIPTIGPGESGTLRFSVKIK